MSARGRLLCFIPDFNYLGLTGRFSAAMLHACAETAASLNLEMTPISLSYSFSRKIVSMATAFRRGGFWAAAPVLNHYSTNKVFEVLPGDKVFVGFHINWAGVRRLISNPYHQEVFVVVHNIESYCRRSRKSSHILNRLFPAIEDWNIEGLRRLDYELGDCHVGCVSDSDQQTLQELGIPCKSLHFVGWTTLLDEQDICLARAGFTGNSNSVSRTLAFMANGRNPDNRAGLDWFLTKVTPLLHEPDRWTLILVGPGWEGQAAASRINIVRTGFMERVSDVLIHGTIGINPDVSGTGVKTKMLDYCALGLPTVSTSLGVQGMRPAGRARLKITDDPSCWSAIFEDLQNPDRWRDCSHAMLDVFSEHASREAFVGRLCDFISAA